MTTKYKVVLVRFPFDDLTSGKVRPAVCLTDPIGPYKHVVLAFITSKITEKILETDIVLSKDEVDFGYTGLRTSSALRLHRMMTVTTDIIQRELGHLSPAKQEVVKNRLRTLFGLED